MAPEFKKKVVSNGKRKLVNSSAPSKSKITLSQQIDQFESFKEIEQEEAFFNRAAAKATKRPRTVKTKSNNSMAVRSTLSSTTKDIDCAEVLRKQIPEEVDDLIVHSNKIKEVRTWLRQKINTNDENRCLLLTGPSGCGKSSTIRLLCDELDVEAVDFELEQGFNVREVWDSDATVYNDAQITVFREFILSSQSKTVETRSRTRRLIIIKELPSTFITDPKKLFRFLQETLPSLKSFLVFALTLIETNWEFSPHRLFPEEALQLFKIQHIKFNAIPRTVMTKKVNAWIESLKIPKNVKFAESIVEKADGDLRSAMSLLEMSFVDNKLINLDFLCSMNSYLDLFRFLGKVMYAKREETANEQWKATEGRLNDDVKPEYRRALPPIEDLNFLATSSTMSISALTDFVMEHEPHLCKDPKTLSRVYADICETAYISSPFPVQTDPTVQEFSRQITIRSVSFNNFKKIIKPPGKYAFRKSAIGESRKKCATLLSEMNSVYPATNLVDTTTFVLPLLGKLKSYVTESEARLCENMDPRIKIDSKRMAQVKSLQPTFDICNDSD